MEIRERIRHLRKKELSLTQEEFAKKINISRSNFGNIESGLVKITERVITDICSAFSLNESWLRTGEGPMYAESESSTLTQVTNLLNLDDTEQKFLAAYLNLPPEIKKNLKETCRQVVDFYSSQNETATTSFAKNGEISRTMENAEK